MNIKTIFKYYWPHVKKYKKSGIIVFLGYGLGTVLATVVVPLFYKRIIDIVSSSQDPQVVGGALVGIMLMLGVTLILYQSIFRVSDYAMAFSQSLIGKDISDDAFRRLQAHSYEFFSNSFTGALVARAKRYINAFETIHDQIVYALWMNGLVLVLAIGVLTWLSPILGGILFIWLFLYIILTFFFTKKKIKKDLLEAEANSKVTATLADAITNISNVKMFSSHKKESAIFSKTTDLEQRRRKDALYFQNLQFTFQAYFIAIFEFAGMFAAIMLWVNGAISAGTIILMQIYILKSFDIVWSIGRNFTRTMRAFAEAKEMVDIFEQPLSVKDRENPEECRIDKGHIKFQNVTFHYGGGGDVFSDFSLVVKPGEKVGLVGPSGAGKTTITKLLLRFADLQKGRILIDGHDISRITQSDLRSKISYVAQDPTLFHRTIRDNIAYSKDGASDNEIMEAAKSAHADDFIKNLPDGYDTLVGERGIKLSGGERQRVAIARAMLKDAPILVLDEATSSLDSLSEKHIQEAFGNLMEGRTTLVIAHRLSTIQKMDRIIVIDNGIIFEEGSHEELIRKEGLYFKLWSQQSYGFMGV